MEGTLLSWTDPAWPDQFIASIQPLERNDLPQKKEPWVSTSTGRRGIVLWSLNGKVKISFNDHEDGTVHNLECFLANYRKV